MNITETIELPLWTFLFVVLLFFISLVLFVKNRIKLHRAEVQLAVKSAEYSMLSNQLMDLNRKSESEKISVMERLAFLQKENEEIKAKNLETALRAEQQIKMGEAQLEALQFSKEGLTKEFESIANNLFEAKQTQFTRTSVEQLDRLMQPFKEQLKDFRNRVDEAQRIDIAQRSQLMGQIEELKKQSYKIGQEAVNLANALKGNNKILGNWGEMILSNILESSGLQKGRDYSLQEGHKAENGKSVFPDAVICLPENKKIVVDVKVSLHAYERYCSSEELEQKKVALKEHVDSLRGHIRNLSGKNYELIVTDSVEFVCLFVPVEAAFVTAVQTAPELLQEAFDKKIILVSPSSLYVVLKTVNSLWQRDRQDKNVEKIMVMAGRLHDQFARFAESFLEVGLGLDKAQRSYELSLNRLSVGNGNLIKRADELQRLGAKTSKSIPSSLKEMLDVNEVEDKLND